MHKRKTAKKMTLNRETLHRLESNDLRKVAGQAEAAGSWESDCGFTCGENSCLYAVLSTAVGSRLPARLGTLSRTFTFKLRAGIRPGGVCKSSLPPFQGCAACILQTSGCSIIII